MRVKAAFYPMRMALSREGLFENDAYAGKISYYGNPSDARGFHLYGDCENSCGVYRYSTGERYFGDFVAGYRSGYGTYYFSNGDKYTGDWLEVQN